MERRAGAKILALLGLSLINSSPVTGRKKPPRLTTAAAPKDLTTFRSAKDENNHALTLTLSSQRRLVTRPCTAFLVQKCSLTSTNLSSHTHTYSRPKQ